LDGQTEVPFVQRQDDMDETNCSRSSGHVGGSSFSLLDYMDYWFSLVHMQQQQQQQQQQPLEADRQTEPPASPPIFLVGTHRNELGGTAVEIEATVARIFLRIKEVLQYKPYFANIVDSFYALDLAEAGSGPSEEQMASFRRHCESVIRFQPYMGEVVCRSSGSNWNSRLPQLVRKKNNIISLDRVTPKISEAYQRLIGSAILNECLLDRYWARHSHQKPLLIGLMEKFDLLALRVENSADSAMRGTTERSFYVPSLLRHRSTLNSPNCSSSVVFYMRFHHFLPGMLKIHCFYASRAG
uniref:RUN domain-containing protein n=1 Tax=Macrostomum lignano TaxID=282301 RepID=A0A1I8GDZ1_9PLAT